MSANLEMIAIVAEGLGDLLPDFVFVGGAAAVLYLDAGGAAEPRPTDDVDCVIEISSHSQYQELEEKLRRRGFANDRRPKAPLCRWVYAGVTVDLMPTDEKILGFSNRWYRRGMMHRITRVLPGGVSVFLFSLPYFIATKLEAYDSRGQGDPRLSSDIEDIFFVLDGSTDPLLEVSRSDSVLQNYLAETFAKLLTARDFNDSFEIHLASERAERRERTRKIVSSIAKL